MRMTSERRTAERRPDFHFEWDECMCASAMVVGSDHERSGSSDGELPPLA
jgi:hypothetical protein